MLPRRLALAALITAAQLVGVAACKHDRPSRVEVVPGQRAGVVREVAGTVTATRPGASARTLAVGDEVSGDDELATGADGSVLIELDHNHVTFTLPAGRTQRVAASLAWNQPVAAAQPVATDEHSAAAGRAIERSAVDTAASSGPPPAATDDGTAGKPVPPAEPIETAKTDNSKPNAQPKSAPPGRSGTVVRRDSKPLIAGAGDHEGPGEGDGETGGGGTETAVGGDLEHAKLKALDDAPPDPKVADAVMAPPSMALAIKTDGALTRDDVAAKIHVEQLEGCWAGTTTPLPITLVVTAAGKVGRLSTKDTAAAKCLRAKLGAVTFAPQQRPTTITLTLTR